MSILDRLHKMLSAVLSDDEIVAGQQLSTNGVNKVARRLGIEQSEVELLIARLRTQLRQDSRRLQEMEQDLHEQVKRYSYEEDFLNGLTIRDMTTGKSLYLQGTAGSELLGRLHSGKEDEQKLLQKYAHLMESGQPNRSAAGCVVVAERTGRVLLAHRSDYPAPHNVDHPDTWATWGGMMEAGESPTETVFRELGEEANFHGKVLQVKPLLRSQSQGLTYHNFAVVVADEFKPHLNWENQGARWFELGSWPANLHPGLAALLADQSSMQILSDVAAHSRITEKAEPLVDADSYDSEISDSGTFNFPWNIHGTQGFATARFKGRGPDMTIEVIYAADSKGVRLANVGPVYQQLEAAAHDFIENEMD